jgi:2-octaprenyl-6-methoxyphenol hydroxylase
MTKASSAKQLGSDYDVLIAGGGMVGASLGCALADAGIRVCIVEPYPVSSDQQPSFDERTTALSRSSRKILGSLGLWDALDDYAQPIQTIHVSEKKRFGTALIRAEEQGVDALGYVVQNRILGEAAWDRLRAATGVTLRCPEKIVSVATSASGVTASTQADDQVSHLSARLLVVADGARSTIRDSLGIENDEREYSQSAIVGNIGVPEEYCRPVAYERFTQRGPIAMLPMRDNRYTFVLTRHRDNAAEVLAMDDAEFTALLQAEFGYRLGIFSRVGKRHAYPLSLVQAQEITRERSVVIGNAAHGLHPVAGQGFNLGLRDVAALAELLVTATREGRGDAGSADILEDYAAWRATDQRNVVAFTDGLVRLFGLEAPVIGTMRGLAVAAFDSMPMVKRALAHHTMGLSGRQSRLARGLDL